MKKCSSCGAELSANEHVCPKCGAKVTGHRFLKEETPAKPRVSPWIWGLVALLAVALAVGSFFLTRAFQAGPQETEPPQTFYTEPEPTTEATEPPTTEEPTTEATEPPTTEPPVIYRNPLNGTILEEPYTGRIFGLTISNTPEVLPHVNASKADIIFESFVNGSIVRFLGLFTDLAQYERVGPIRSTRMMFNDIADHYDVVLAHAGGSGYVLGNAKNRGLDHFNIDQWVAVSFGASIRDKDRAKKIDYVSSFLAIGPKVVEFAESNGIRVTGEADKDYLLRFNDDGTPEDGETAEHIDITITYNKNYKNSILDYNPETGRYTYSQYGKVMTDWDSGEEETYRNVLVLFADITYDNGYQVADFCAGGTGYFACGGKLIPITWGCDGEELPFWFKTMDGEPLELGVGNSYIAITQPESVIAYGPAVMTEDVQS